MGLWGVPHKPIFFESIIIEKNYMRFYFFNAYIVEASI